MNYVFIVLLFIASYLIGSIQSGLYIGKIFKKIDIREHGSHNTGSTNAIRVLGFKYGIWAFVFDTFKGAIVILILRLNHATNLYMLNDSFNFIVLYGFFAVLGHVFSVFNNFKGGKAVATSLGVIFAIEPIIAILTLSGFLITFIKSRYVSLGSTVAVAVTMLGFISRIFIPVATFGDITQISKVFELGIFILFGLTIVLKHKTNYQRLKSGTENKM